VFIAGTEPQDKCDLHVVAAHVITDHPDEPESN